MQIPRLMPVTLSDNSLNKISVNGPLEVLFGNCQTEAALVTLVSAPEYREKFVYRSLWTLEYIVI